MTTKITRNKAASPQKLTLPDLPKKDWDILVRDMKLTPEQAWALAVALEHLSTDLDQEQARRDAMPRARLVMRFKKIEAQLSALLAEMDRAQADMIHFLPHESLAEIGRAMTFESIGLALGRDVVPKSFKETVLAKLENNAPISPAAIKSEAFSARELLGLKHGDVILRDFLGRIHKPMQLWIERDKQNKGGKPAHMIRRCVVYYLARSAPDIIGRKAGVSETGPFVELCAAVLRAMRLPDEGVGKVVPGVVRQLREDMGLATARKAPPRRRKKSSSRAIL